MMRTSGPLHRVVSLVPSTTGSLFDLGLGERVVGITDYCIYPADQLADLPRLGGTKNPNLDEIIALKPDLVLVNQEENTKQAVQALHAAGLDVHLSFPRTVDDSWALLQELAELFESDGARQRVSDLQQAVEDLPPRPKTPRRAFVPIWEGDRGDTHWWMTFNGDSYSHAILRRCGFTNVFVHRRRRYPLAADLGLAPPEESKGRDIRYPRVVRQEVLDLWPDVILLPSEPYEYGQEDIARLAETFEETPAVQGGQIKLVDGTWLTWPGTRMVAAIEGLTHLAREMEPIQL